MKFFYFINEAVRSLVEGKMVTVVSVITVALTLFFLTLISLGMINLSRWVDHYQQEASVAAFFDLSIPDSAAEKVVQELKRDPRISSAQFISRAEAYEKFSELYGKELLAGVETNPFPASVELVPHHSVPAESLELFLTNIEGVESVSFSRQWIETMQRYRNGFQIAAVVVMLIILVVLYFTITNTIKLTVFARMDLLVNMQYIGAGWWYVRLPFLLEGIIQGLLGAGIAYAGISMITLLLDHQALFTGGSSLFWLLALIGALLGFAGSLDAVRQIPSTAGSLSEKR